MKKLETYLFIFVIALVVPQISYGNSENEQKTWYIGCFYISRTSDSTISYSSDVTTVVQCCKLCSYKSYPLAFISSKKCSCAEESEEMTKVAENMCNYSCEGDALFKCGGKELYSAYRTEGPYIQDIEQDYPLGRIGVLMGQPVNISIQVRLGSDPTVPTGLERFQNASFSYVKTQSIIENQNYNSQIPIVNKRGDLVITHTFTNYGSIPIEIRVQNPIGSDFYTFQLAVTSPVPGMLDLRGYQVDQFIKDAPSCEKQEVRDNSLKTIQILPGDSVEIIAELYYGVNINFIWNVCGKFARTSTPFREPGSTCHFSFCKSDKQIFEFNHVQECLISVTASNEFGILDSSILIQVVAPEIRDLSYVQTMDCNTDMTCQKSNSWGENNYYTNNFYGWEGPYADDPNRLTSPNEEEENRLPPGSFMVKSKICFQVSAFITVKGSTSVDIRFGDGYKIRRSLRVSFGFPERFRRSLNSYGDLWGSNTTYISPLVPSYERNSPQRTPEVTSCYLHGCILNIYFSHTYSRGGRFNVEVQISNSTYQAAVRLEKSLAIVGNGLGSGLQCQGLVSVGERTRIVVLDNYNDNVFAWAIHRRVSTNITDEGFAQWEKITNEVNTSPYFYTFQRSGVYFVRIRDSGSLGPSCTIVVEEEISGVLLKSNNDKQFLEVGEEIMYNLQIERGSNFTITWQFFDKIVKEDKVFVGPFSKNFKYRSTNAGCNTLSAVIQNTVSSISVQSPLICFEEKVTGIELIAPNKSEIGSPLKVAAITASGSNLEVSVVVSCINGTDISAASKTTGNQMGSSTFNFTLPPLPMPGSYVIQFQAINHVTPKEIAYVESQLDAGMFIRNISVLNQDFDIGQSVVTNYENVLMVLVNGFPDISLGILYTWTFPHSINETSSEVKTIITSSPIISLTPTMNKNVDIDQVTLTAQSGFNDVTITFPIKLSVLNKTIVALVYQHVVAVDVTSYVDVDCKMEKFINYYCQVVFSDNNSSVEIAANTSKSIDHTFTLPGLWKIEKRVFNLVGEIINKFQSFIVVQQKVSKINLKGSMLLHLNENSIGHWHGNVSQGNNLVYMWTVSKRSDPNYIYKQTVGLFCQEDFSYTFKKLGSYNITLRMFNDISSQSESLMVDVQRQPILFLVNVHSIYVNKVATFLITLNKTLNCNLTATWGDQSKSKQFILNKEKIIFSNQSLSTYLISHVYNLAGEFDFVLTIQWFSGKDLLIRDYKGSLTAYHLKKPPIKLVASIEKNQTTSLPPYFALANNTVHFQANITDYAQSITWLVLKENIKIGWYGTQIHSKEVLVNTTLQFANTLQKRMSLYDFVPKKMGGYIISATIQPGNFVSEIKVNVYSPLSFINFKANKIKERNGYRRIDNWCKLHDPYLDFFMSKKGCNPLLFDVESDGVGVVFEYKLDYYFNVWNSSDTKVTVVRIPGQLNNIMMKYNGSFTYRFEAEGNYTVSCTALSMDFYNTSKVVSRRLVSQHFFTVSEPDVSFLGHKEYIVVETDVPYNFTLQRKIPNTQQRIFVEWRMDLRGFGLGISGADPPGNTISGLDMLVYSFAYKRRYVRTTKRVTVTARNEAGYKSFFTNVLVLDRIKNVSLIILGSGSKGTQVTGKYVTFRAIDEPDFSAEYITWFINDVNNNVTTVEKYLDRVFTIAGTYTLWLDATNAINTISSPKVVIKIVNSIPFHLNLSCPSSVKFGETINFFLLNFGKGAPSVAWDMGDGNKYVEGYSVDHLYSRTGVYLVQVTVSNEAESFNRFCEVFVMKEICQIPYVVIANVGDPVTHFPYKRIRFEAMVYFNCSYVNGVNYSWVVQVNDHTSKSIPSLTGNNQVFELPPYSLVADRYMIIVNVTFPGTVLYTSYRLPFQIQSSYPTAKIAGKTVGTYSRSDNIVIDGSPSYTIDDPPMSSNSNLKQTLMRYSWECYVLNFPEKSCFWNESDLQVHKVRTFPLQNSNSVTRSYTAQQSYRDLKLYEKFPSAIDNHESVLNFSADVLAKDQHIFVFRLIVNIHAPGEPADAITYILNIEDKKPVANIDLVCPLCVEPSVSRQSITMFAASCTNCNGGHVEYSWSVEILEDDSKSFYANESSNCAPPDGSGWALPWANNGTSNESISQTDIDKDEEERIMKFNITDQTVESNELELHEKDKNFTGVFSLHNNIPGENNPLLPQYNSYENYGEAPKLLQQDYNSLITPNNNPFTTLPNSNNIYSSNNYEPRTVVPPNNVYPVKPTNNAYPYQSRLPITTGHLSNLGAPRKTWVQGDNNSISDEKPNLLEKYNTDQTFADNQYDGYDGLGINPYAPLGGDSSQYMDLLQGLGNNSLFGGVDLPYGENPFSRSGGFYEYLTSDYGPIQEGDHDGRPDGRPNSRPTYPPNYFPSPNYATVTPTTTLAGDSLLNADSKTGLGFNHYQDKKHTAILLDGIIKKTPDLPQYLVVKRSSLIEGKTYAVTARVTQYDDNGNVIKKGQAGYYFRINRGPSYGQCSVSEGYLGGLYRVHCIGWKTKQYYATVNKLNKESEMVYYDFSYGLTENGKRRALYYGSSYDCLFALPASHNEVLVHVKLYNGEGDQTNVCSFPINVTRENRTDINDINFVYNNVVGNKSVFYHILLKKDDNNILAYTNVMLDSLPELNLFKNISQIDVIRFRLQDIVQSLSYGLSQISTNGVVRYQDVLFALERLSQWHDFFTNASTGFVMEVINHAISSEIASRNIDLNVKHYQYQKPFVNLAREIDYKEDADNIFNKILTTLDALTLSLNDLYSEYNKTYSNTYVNKTKLHKSMRDVENLEENLRNYFLKSSEEIIQTFGSNKIETSSINLISQNPEGNLINIYSDDFKVGAIYPKYLINILNNYKDIKYTQTALTYYHQGPYIANDMPVKMDPRAISLWVTDTNLTEIKVRNLKRPITIFLPPRQIEDKMKKNSSFSVFQGKMAVHSFKVEKSTNYTLHIQVEAEELTSRPFAVAVAFSGQPLSTKSPLNDTNILAMGVFSAKRARSLKRIGTSSTVKLTFKPGELDSSLTYYISLWNANSETTKLERRFSHQKVNYRINIWWADCFYWNKEMLTWKNDGCQILNTSSLTQTVCQTYHLSTYSSSFERIEAPLETHDLILIVATRALSSCLTVLVALFVFFFGFLAIHRFVLRHRDMNNSDTDELVNKSLGVGDWLRWWLGTDDHGASGRVPVILRDNKPEHKQVYEITLQTGNWPGSGTTSLANVILYGEKGKYEARELIAPSRGHYSEQTFATSNHCRKKEICLYETGSSKTFIVTFDSNLGSLWKVSIWHDHAGTRPRWYLDYVNIRDVNTDEKWFFPCHSWLALDRGVNRIYQDLTPMENRPNFWRHFAIRIRNFMIDYHSFLSIFSCAHWGALTRSQRIVHGLALCVVIMALSTEKMILVAAKNLRSDYSYFSLESVTWGLAIGALTSLLLLPAQLIFRYSKRDERISMMIEDSTNGSTESPFPSYSNLTLPNKYGQTLPGINSRIGGGLHKTSTLTQNVTDLVTNHEPMTNANEAVCDWLKEKQMGSQNHVTAEAGKLGIEEGKVPGYAGSLYSWPIGRSMTSFDEEIARCMMTTSTGSLSSKKEFYSGDEGMTSSCHSNYLNESYVTSDGGLDDVGSRSNLDSYDGEYLDIDGLAMDGPALIPCEKLEAISRRHAAPLPRKCAYLAWLYYLILVAGSCAGIIYASAYIMEDSDFAGWIEISCFALFWTTVVIETLTVGLFAMLQTMKNVWGDADLSSTHATLFPAVDAAAVDNYAYKQQQEQVPVKGSELDLKDVGTLDATEIKLRVLERRRSRYLRTILPPYDRRGRWRKSSDPLRKTARMLRKKTSAERASVTWMIYFILVFVLFRIVSLQGVSDKRHWQDDHVTSWFDRGFFIQEDFTITSNVNFTASIYDVINASMWRKWFECTIMSDLEALPNHNDTTEHKASANNILLGDIRIWSLLRKQMPRASVSEKWGKFLQFNLKERLKKNSSLEDYVSPVTGRVYIVEKLFKMDLFYRNKYFYSNLSVENYTDAVTIDFLSYNTVTEQYTVVKALVEFQNSYFRHATYLDIQTTSLGGKVASNWLILCHVILIIWVAGCAIRNLLNLTENRTLSKRSRQELSRRSLYESSSTEKLLNILVWLIIVAYLIISTTLRYFTFLVSDTMEQGGHAGCKYLSMMETVLFWEMFSRCALAIWTVLVVVQGVVLLVTLHGPKNRLSRVVMATSASMRSAFAHILLPFIGVIFVATSLGFLAGLPNFTTFSDGLQWTVKASIGLGFYAGFSSSDNNHIGAFALILAGFLFIACRLILRGLLISSHQAHYKEVNRKQVKGARPKENTKNKTNTEVNKEMKSNKSKSAKTKTKSRRQYVSFYEIWKVNFDQVKSILSCLVTTVFCGNLPRRFRPRDTEYEVEFSRSSRDSLTSSSIHKEFSLDENGDKNMNGDLFNVGKYDKFDPKKQLDSVGFLERDIDFKLTNNLALYEIELQVNEFYLRATSLIDDVMASFKLTDELGKKKKPVAESNDVITNCHNATPSVYSASGLTDESSRCGSIQSLIQHRENNIQSSEKIKDKTKPDIAQYIKEENTVSTEQSLSLKSNISVKNSQVQKKVLSEINQKVEPSENKQVTDNAANKNELTKLPLAPTLTATNLAKHNMRLCSTTEATTDTVVEQEVQGSTPTTDTKSTIEDFSNSSSNRSGLFGLLRVKKKKKQQRCPSATSRARPLRRSQTIFADVKKLPPTTEAPSQTSKENTSSLSSLNTQRKVPRFAPAFETTSSHSSSSAKERCDRKRRRREKVERSDEREKKKGISRSKVLDDPYEDARDIPGFIAD